MNVVNICTHTLQRGIASDIRSASRRASKSEIFRQCLRSISSSSTARRPCFVHNRVDNVKAVRVLCPAKARTFTSSPLLQKKGRKASRNDVPKEEEQEQRDNADKQATDDPFDFTNLSAEVKQAHERLREDLSKLRAGGRFNPEVLERLRVQPDKSSKDTIPLSDVAQVIPKGRTVQLIIGEQDYVKPVVSAIQGSDLSLTPQPDPTGANPLLLEIKIPPPTAESRQNAVKEAVKAGEKASVIVQKARAKQHKKHQAMRSIKTIRPDDLRKAAAEMEKAVEAGQAEVKKIVDNAKKLLESA